MPIENGVLTITPEDIVITNHLWDSFGQHESEISADWLVRFAQDRKQGWRPFSHDDIEAFYSRSGKLHGFSFNRLVSGGFIRMTADNTYHYTEDFVARCYRAATRHA